MAKKENYLNPGRYSQDYFSGCQTAIYIGDTWIDDVTSIQFEFGEQIAPLFGYSDQLWRKVAKGRIMVQGMFSINFKEAGYLFLALNEYQKKVNGKQDVLSPFLDTGKKGGSGASINEIDRRNVEQMFNDEPNMRNMTELYKQISALHSKDNQDKQQQQQLNAYNSLGGFASADRLEQSQNFYGFNSTSAEGWFEFFEDQVWKKPTFDLEQDMGRRITHEKLNGFEIYLAYGAFTGIDESDNHTIMKMTDVRLTGKSQRIVVNGEPIQEVYSFIARNLI